MSQPETNEEAIAVSAQDAGVGTLPTAPTHVRVVVPRWIQLVLLPLAILGGWELIQTAGSVLMLFTIAALIALLLNPFVAGLQRLGLPRGIAVLVVILAVLCVIGGLGALAANPIADQASAFQKHVPRYVHDANDSLARLQKWLDKNGVHAKIADQGQTALETLGKRLTQGSGDVVSTTRDLLTKVVEASIAVILTIVLSIYMLLYGERIGTLVRSVLPSDGTPANDYPTRIQHAVQSYVRGQLLFSFIMGTSAGLGVFVLGLVGIFPEGRDYAIAFGAFYGFAELIPYVGPAIGAAPPVLIALFGEPLDAVWLTVFFVALQQLEGHVVAPQVFSHSLRINPLLVIAALLLGGQVYGLIGAFIALPIAAMVRETVIYVRNNFRLEPWPTASPVLAGALPLHDDPGGPGPPGQTRRGSPNGEAVEVVAAARRARADLPDGDDGGADSHEPGHDVDARADAATTRSNAASAIATDDVTPEVDDDLACPECGARVGGRAELCPSCGTELGPPGAAAAATSSAPG